MLSPVPLRDHEPQGVVRRLGQGGGFVCPFFFLHILNVPPSRQSQGCRSFVTFCDYAPQAISFPWSSLDSLMKCPSYPPLPPFLVLSARSPGVLTPSVTAKILPPTNRGFSPHPLHSRQGVGSPPVKTLAACGFFSLFFGFFFNFGAISFFDGHW